MSNTAVLYINMWFDCPACEESLDLFCEADCWETGNMDDGCTAFDMLSEWVNNRDHVPVTGTCGKCGKEFIVDSIEY